jgi:hypothetical protein
MDAQSTLAPNILPQIGDPWARVHRGEYPRQGPEGQAKYFLIFLNLEPAIWNFVARLFCCEENVLKSVQPWCLQYLLVRWKSINFDVEENAASDIKLKLQTFS